MTLSLHHEFSAPDRIVVHVGGRLDAMTFGEFDQAMLALLPRLGDSGTVVVDLAGLEYVSSAGLRSFARIRKSMRIRNGHTLLLNPQPQVRKVFDIVKAVPVNEVFTSAQELDAYLDRMQRQVIEGDDDA
ncbi:MAG: STAS domain-containing protein [Rhodanobacter sp.]|uniref:STAS domain-containing protein n=1 Tax=Rhodanobacter sp. KK11 TaxID=3083255 RepID=UPI0029666FAF|nr:STAS domain-containing protein [Rhodanobacter sp. KK11]MDW2980639.1 STAS domain-containing protein [Rhodanobacter sp. KK11]